MEMKQYSIGFVFNNNCSRVLLIEKKKPKWMKGKWNGIGGKIEDSETPLQAMKRESIEETDCEYDFALKIILICPSGTVYIFAAIEPTINIIFSQVETERLASHQINNLYKVNIMSNLKFIIPLCLADLHFPITLIENDLGTEDINWKELERN
jgi:8-oxo-dGTP diphosphatase